MSAIELSASDIEAFGRDGFVVKPGVLDADTVGALHSRFERLFGGEFETGVRPDEVNWQAGRDDPGLTRQLCNVWKADRLIAATALRGDLARLCAVLAGWPGARINQDNLFWKPPGAGALGFHQDAAYEHWVVPCEMVSCWMALDDTSAQGGTIEYIRGSHTWGEGERSVAFHGPDDPLIDVERAAKKAGIAAYDRAALELSAGDVVFHHGWVWHGSAENRSERPRRSLVMHCMSSEARFHETEVTPVYSRYKRHGSTEMDESFFPILWREDGYRSAFL